MEANYFLKTCLVFIVSLFISLMANASTITWTGNYNNEWNQVENWSPMIVPNTNDDVIIPNSCTSEILIIGANASCKTITYNGSGFDLQISTGWEFIIAGDLNITGNSAIYGLGGIEVVGNNNCTLNYSDSTTLEVNHIYIKSSADTYLTRAMNMPYGSIEIFSGNLITNGFDVTINSLSIIDGISNRSLNIDNSLVKVSVLSLDVVNGGSFSSKNSVVENKLLIKTNGVVSFNVINSNNKTAIKTTQTNARINISQLNAAGDIDIIGSSGFQNQVFSIVAFNILQTPSIVTLSPETTTSGYYFFVIQSPNGCNGEILFTDRAEVDNEQVKVYIVGGVTLPKASMASIHVVSGSFVVNEGTDIGNNTGIVFNQTTPTTYYWINGTGDWNDASHWSLYSGGTPSGCIPSLKDHAIFNNASGFGTNDTVHLSHHIFCNDLVADPSMINKPLLKSKSGTTYTFNIQGNVDLTGFSTFDARYPIYFWNRSTIGIQTASHTILDDVFFSNTGTCELLNDFNCFDGQKSIYQQLGTFKTNGYILMVSSFISKGVKVSASVRSLSLSNSVLHIGHPTSCPGTVVMYSDSLDLYAGTSLFNYRYLQNLNNVFKIDGFTHLNFYNVRFLNQVGNSYLIYNQRSSFNKIQFNGGGSLLNGSLNNSSEVSSMDTLVISGKFRYEFEQSKMISINKKVVHLHSACNEISMLTSTSLANKAYILTNGNSALVFENTWIENIQAEGSFLPFVVLNGVNGGSNTNFNFQTINTPQIYYWNGEANSPVWSVGANWNIGIQPHTGTNNDQFIYNINGCVPGFNDSVVFHTNSFPVIDTVIINENVNFKGMMWLPGSGYSRVIAGNNQYSMNNYGGLSLDNDLTMLYDGNLFFRSPFCRQLHFKSVIIPGMMTFYNLGKYILMDSLTSTGYLIQLLAGSFSSSNHTINASRFWISHEHAPAYHNNIVNFGSSIINISANFSGNLFNNVSDIIAQNSTINFTGAGSTMSVSGNHPNIHFGHINYTSNNGYVGLLTNYYYGNGIPHFAHINYNPSGFILGENSIDTLVLAEGKDYSLESNSVQYINDLLYSKGSPCYRTTIASTIPGTRAYIKNQNCHLLVEHARLRDIEGILGNCNTNNYLVGVGGEDLGNNKNWNFIPGNPINGLGIDTVLTCNTLPYIQTTFGFGRYESILWNNGTANSQLLIDTVSTISVSVTYTPTCIVNDTRIFSFEDQIDQSGTITDITCYGSVNGNIQLEINDVDSMFEQTWIYPNNDIREKSTSLNNLGAGNYISIVTIPGFEKMCSDTTTFTINEPALLSVVLDTTIAGKCSDPDGTILITSTGGTGEHSYLWNNEVSTEDNYTAWGGSNHVVVADTNGCTAQLTVELNCIEHIHIPELITPNGDGFGDNWEIIDLYRLYPNNDVKLLNRWGNVVYHKKGYNDEFTGIPNTGDTFNIGYLSSGTYFYVIDLGEKYKTLTGYVELIY